MRKVIEQFLRERPQIQTARDEAQKAIIDVDALIEETMKDALSLQDLRRRLLGVANCGHELGLKLADDAPLRLREKQEKSSDGTMPGARFIGSAEI